MMLKKWTPRELADEIQLLLTKVEEETRIDDIKKKKKGGIVRNGPAIRATKGFEGLTLRPGFRREENKGISSEKTC